MKIILLILLLTSSALYAGDFEDFINYKTLREYKNYYSEGHIEVKQTPMSFVINTKANSNYVIFIHSTNKVEFTVYDGSFSDIRIFNGRGVFTFKASSKNIMIIVNGKGYTKFNWGSY